MTTVPEIRSTDGNAAPIRNDGDFVLYWMVAYRRLDWNFALQRAVDWARRLRRPLVILEALRCDYPRASDRLHRFVLDGMADNARRLEGARALYYPYVERAPGAGSGLLEALAARACMVITDEFPAFFLPRMIGATAARLGVRLETVDSNGLLPLRAADGVFKTAHSFRRHLQRALPEHLGPGPREHPLVGSPLARPVALPDDVVDRWPATPADELESETHLERRLPVDHSVPPIDASGGPVAAARALGRFIEEGLPRYAEAAREPEAGATSGLSPYLHFGHISSQAIFGALIEREDWDVDRLSGEARGDRRGWWGMTESAEAFLDQLVTWRELGFNMCAHRDDYAEYESLPDWARETLARHADDPREHVYDLETFEAAETHDPIWNAAQTQLLREGRIHNYLRMLWGKKILEWSPAPRDALEVMIELNDRYAVDGRDPNSYSGIAWCLGRYDRPWGPERPVFGTVRYMSSESTRRKLSIDGYVRRFSR